jgi:hypothetical protein
MFDLKAKTDISKADKCSCLMSALRPHPALYNAINHMCITQAVTKAGDVTFHDFVEMISNQATLVDSQAPKKETPRKMDAAKKRWPWSR